MNTLRRDFIPNLNMGKDYVFIFEDLELAFERDELRKIAKQWNQGVSISKLSSTFKHVEMEILLAIIYQANRGQIKRPFANLLKGSL